MFEKLRDESLEGPNEDWLLMVYAIGGLSVREPKEDMMRILDHMSERMLTCR